MSDATTPPANVTDVLNANVTQFAMLGARNVVLTKFLDAALVELTADQRVRITESFRRRVDEALYVMDSFSLPAEYQTALLDLTNEILGSLAR